MRNGRRTGGRRRPTLAAAAVVALLAAFALFGPQASSGFPGGSKHLPARKGGADAGVLVQGYNADVKAKTTIKLTRFLLHVYANEKFKIKHGILISHSRAWVVQNPSKHPTYGIFPTTHSAILGFGSIPITADIVLVQPIRHGQITPLQIDTRAQANGGTKPFPTFVTGPVVLYLTNVQVDQVPLDVGTDCHTRSPIQLDLRGIAPTYNLFTGGRLHGLVDIPPFTGCGANGDDLDPLITGTISGPDNPLTQYQGGLGGWNNKVPGDCTGCFPPKDPGHI